MSTENPLVQGGQGRSSSDLIEDATILGTIVIMILAIVLAALWMGR